MLNKFRLFIKILCICAVIFFTNIAYAATISITPSHENGVYEENESIECVINYTSSGSIRVNVDNYFGNNVFSKAIGYVSGSGSTTVTITGLGTGWYDVIVNQGNQGVSAQIAVVPSLSDRYSGQSPFATDLAANHILRDTELTANYSDVAKKAGFNWIRERYSWWMDSSSFAPVIEKESEAGLDVVALSAEYSTGGYTSQEAMFTDDLFKAYNYQKNITSKMADKVDMWEIWNEMDHENFLQIPADIYTPFFKAAAIGVKDSGADAKVMFGGLCVYPDSNDFAKMMIKNDILRYSDVYNIHRHLAVQSTATQEFDAKFVNEHEALMKTSGYNRPLWVTEAGLAMSAVTLNNLKKQTRYAVTSMIESVANGVDKHFWFILPKFADGSKLEYGVFNEKGLPRPAYASIAVATDILGVGEYKGKYNSSAFNGYVFNNGTKDVLVAWSNNSTSLNVTQTYKAYDIMGNAISGTVTVGNDPVYLVFDNILNTYLYTQAATEEKEMTSDLTTNDRIVIQTDFNGIEAIRAVRDRGYSIGRVETRSVDVKVYNFNDVEVSGTLNCTADGFTVTGDGEKITIPAKASVSCKIMLTPDTVEKNVPQYISFYVTTAEGNTSPTVVKVVVCEGIKIEPEKTAPQRKYRGPLSRGEKGLTFNNKDSADIKVDLSKPVKNPSNLTISGQTVTFTKQSQYVEYEIDVKNAGSYYINFKRANIDTGNFFIYALVNGETINRRTGRDDLDDGSHVFQDEVWLNEGINTIRIGNMSSNDGTLSSLSLTRLENVQYTTSMNPQGGGNKITDTNISPLYVDPWLNTGILSTKNYPDGENSPYVTFKVEIPKAGYYYPAVAAKTNDKISMSIAGKSFAISEDYTALEEIYYASGKTNKAVCTWLRANEIVYLEPGVYDVTLKLYEPKADSWSTYIGAVRFIEFISPEAPWVEYDFYAEETGAYCVSVASGGQNYPRCTINGSEVSYKTGRTKLQAHTDGYSAWYIHENLVPLYKGKNTVRLELFPKHDETGAVYWDANISEILFVKVDDMPMTGITAKAMTDYKTNVEGLTSLDPWAYKLNIEQSEPPYIKWNFEVFDTGYYKVRLAYGSSYIHNINIGGKVVSFENTTKLGTYCLPSYLDKKAPWYEVSDEIYLEKGTYPITMTLADNSEGKWNMSFAGFQLVEVQRENIGPWVTAEKKGDSIKINYEAPMGTEFDIIIACFEEQDGVKRLKNILTPISVTGADEVDIKTIPVDYMTEDKYEVYVWDSLLNAKPLLENIEVQ